MKKDKIDFKKLEGKVTDIVSRVCQDFDNDVTARTDWEARRTRYIELYKMWRKTKRDPWENCSNVMIPLLGIAVNQFQTRCFDALFANENMVKSELTPRGIEALYKSKSDSKMEQVRAEAMQLAGAMKQAGQGIDKKTLDEALVSRINELKKKIFSELDTDTADLNYGLSRFLSADLARNPTFKKSHDRLTLWVTLDGTAFKKVIWDSEKDDWKSVFCSASNIYIPYTGEKTMDDAVPGHVIHRFKRTVNKIKINQRDKQYYTKPDMIAVGADMMDTGALKDAEQKDSPMVVPQTGNQDEKTILEWHGYYDLDGDGIEEPVVATVLYEQRELLRMEERVDDAGKEINYFVQYDFIPSPGCAYAQGIGSMLADMQDTIQSLINQTLDNLTLSNLPWGLAAKTGSFGNQGIVGLAPGVIKEIETYGKPIEQAILFPRIQGVNPLIMQIITWLWGIARELSSVSDIMTGQSNKVEAATAIIAKVEQSTKVFQVISGRIGTQMGKEVELVYKLLKIHRRAAGMIFYMPQDSNRFEAISTKIFDLDFALSFRIDLSGVMRIERLKKAEITYGICSANPFVANDPAKNYQLLKYYLTEIGVPSEKINAILGIDPAEQEPQAPPDKNQIEENADVITGHNPEALPQQNHAEHLRVIENFMTSSWWATLDQARKDVVLAHARKHQAFRYAQVEMAKAKSEQSKKAPAPGQEIPAQIAAPQPATSAEETVLPEEGNEA